MEVFSLKISTFDITNEYLLPKGNILTLKMYFHLCNPVSQPDIQIFSERDRKWILFVTTVGGLHWIIKFIVAE